MRDAKVNGVSIVPDHWVADATRTSNVAKRPNGSGYGYQWWGAVPPVYDAIGIFGQLIHINPEKELFAVCARTMRRILVDAARARATAKRGGGLQRVDDSPTMMLEQMPDTSADRAADICALDDALEGLARLDPRRAQVVEMRFFAGLTVEETAQALAVSEQTVIRDWRLARAWLARELRRTKA